MQVYLHRGFYFVLSGGRGRFRILFRFCFSSLAPTLILLFPLSIAIAASVRAGKGAEAREAAAGARQGLLGHVAPRHRGDRLSGRSEPAGACGVHACRHRRGLRQHPGAGDH